ncbi:MAG: hypothetical protein H6993_07035 [Pseudomonadales bacterium]|nr:hypothetical protein [Pseudomonadales bacterium]
MTIAELGALGEFVGSLAVLATLIYLAIQTRQSKEAVISATRLNIMDQRVRSLWSQSESAHIPLLIAKAMRDEALDDEELVRVRALFKAEFVRCRYMFAQEITAESAPGTMFGTLKEYQKTFGRHGGEIWNDYIENTGASSAFVEWVEEHVPFNRERDA